MIARMGMWLYGSMQKAYLSFFSPQALLAAGGCKAVGDGAGDWLGTRVGGWGGGWVGARQQAAGWVGGRASKSAIAAVFYWAGASAEAPHQLPS